ncbi:MAG: tyrosine-type recombinase/integrase [Emcibacter sp.]|nr:tyrosine-type recombinase/integrase [Emcibacter sp.]
MVSDTGMRLAEVAGLLREDIFKDERNLFARVRPHPWRRLKTKGSERIVPLEGIARWAALQVLSQTDQSLFAFPRYNKSDKTNANSASSALSKWLKEYVTEQCTMHSFRHSLRDRLRAVECPADIVDQIGGWQTDGIGHAYGSGYPLKVLRKWMKEVTKADMVYGSKQLL